MTPEQLLTEARRLLDEPTDETEGVWARACAVLTRQALEQAVASFLGRHVESLENVNYRAQMLSVYGVAPDPSVAARAHFVWAAISRALHHNGYTLPPTAESLRGWIDVVEEVVERLR